MALTFVSPLSGKELTSAELQQTQKEHKRHFPGEREERTCYVTKSSEMMKRWPSSLYKLRNKEAQPSNTTDTNPSSKK